MPHSLKSHMMSPVSRRTLLQICGGVTLTSVAGCAMTDSAEELPEGRLVELYVLNLDDQPHTVSVLLQRGGEPVYRESMDAAAFDTSANRAGGGPFEDYPTSAGTYTLYAWYDDQPTTEWQQYGFISPEETASEDQQCLRIHLKVGDRHNQSTPPRLAIFTGNSC